MPRLVSDRPPPLPAACTSTTKIVAKVNGKKPLARPKNQLEVSLEAKNFNNLVAISLKKDRLKVQLVKPRNGCKGQSIVCVERISPNDMKGEGLIL